MRYSKQILLPQSYTLFLFSDKDAVFLLRESETRVTIRLHFSMCWRSSGTYQVRTKTVSKPYQVQTYRYGDGTEL